MDALAADIIPEGWRGTLARFTSAAAEASSAAAAKLGPAVHGVARQQLEPRASTAPSRRSRRQMSRRRSSSLPKPFRRDGRGRDGGELTAEEIHAALLKNDADASLERVKELVAKADTDGNGTVSREEYLEALNKDIIPEGWARRRRARHKRAEIASKRGGGAGPRGDEGAQGRGEGHGPARRLLQEERRAPRRRRGRVRFTTGALARVDATKPVPRRRFEDDDGPHGLLEEGDRCYR